VPNNNLYPLACGREGGGRVGNAVVTGSGGPGGVVVGVRFFLKPPVNSFIFCRLKTYDFARITIFCE
jgi:hypothetical protein